MKRVMVRYKLRDDKVDENVRLVEAVFAQLAEERPDGVRYATFKLPDGVSFMHVASIETTNGSNPMGALKAFQSFTAAIQDRCVEPPVATELETVGAYRAFDLR